MSVFQELAKLEAQGAAGALCTVIETVGSVPQVPGARMLVRADGSTVGTVGGGALEHEVAALARAAIEDGSAPALHAFNLQDDLGMACGGRTSVFIEPLWRAPNLVIFGAGHIGRELCAMGARVGFRVTVVDEREEWADPAALPDAAEVVAGDPVELLERLPVDEESYVVLVSHSHAVDQRILQQVVQRPSRYLGMIASRRKRKQVFDRLQDEGIDAALLQRVHSPIGLRIGAVDPAEIAVSILAELIRVRRGAPEDPESAFPRPRT